MCLESIFFNEDSGRGGSVKYYFVVPEVAYGRFPTPGM